MVNLPVSESLSLAGLSIVVTRPARQNDALVQQLCTLGADVAAIPLLAIEPLQEPVQRQAIDAQLFDLPSYQTAIFISQNAAEQALLAMAARNLCWPVAINAYAIGAATTAFLAEHGIAANTPAQMNSEGLLALPALQNVANTRCLIFRGLGGRETLAETLRQRGAYVEYCELYRRQMPPSATHQWVEWLKMHPEQRALVCINSIDTLNHLLAIDPLVVSRQQLTLLLPGQRVAAAARAAGFANVCVAEDATDYAMVYAACLHAAIL